MPRPRFVADANMPLLDETFERHGEILRLPGREITRERLQLADVLLVRSVTRVDESLLRGTAVRFVGTATIGMDHLDTDFLESRGIRWSAAPGCNADAAAQYALGLVLLACQRLGRRPAEQSVGIVGRGHVGSRLGALLDALGISWVACDPPLADAGVEGLVALETALDNDIVSLHVPLTQCGTHATLGMIGEPQLAAMPTGALLVNTSRGDVVQENALLKATASGQVHAALDVWHAEPDINPDLAQSAAVATPHVAGYSIEGRNRGTLAIYRAWLDFTGGEASVSLPASPANRVAIRAGNIADAVIEATGVARDDAAMRACVTGRFPAEAFDALRREYPLRREFAATEVIATAENLSGTLAALGFHIAGH